MKAQPKPSSPSAALYAQALEHFRANRMAPGIELMKKALELNPGSGEMHAHLATALYRTGNEQQAAGHFEKAARLAPRIPEIQNDCGLFLLETNRPQEAERLFRKALQLRPDFPQAHLNLGRSLYRQGRYDEVEKPYLAALRLKPDWPGALCRLGQFYLRVGGPERQLQGRQCLEKALAVNPKEEEAWAPLIRSYERDGDHETEEKLLDQAEKHIPDSLELAVIRLGMLMRQGKKDELPPILDRVSQRLHDISRVSPVVLHDLGQGYDAVGDIDNAMRWFRASSKMKEQAYAAQKSDLNAFPAKIEGYRRSLTGAGNWKPAPPLPPDVPCPVFLVGFPRSGTTLLDQIFAGHSAIEVAEEKPALREAERWISQTGKKPEWDMLDKIGDDEIAAARELYFSILKKTGSVLKPGGVFIDKFPLNLVSTPFVRRLFPEARFIMALRHPCDCVLSNYMQRFIPNEAMVHMNDMDNAARLYDRCFSAWEDAVRTLDFQFHAIKYEDVVTDMKAEIVRALGFLGLEWQDSVAAFDETAKKRQIRTPSRTQVTQKLYTRARGRWHRYREYMGGVPEMLRPWIEKFGYEID